MDAAAAIEHLAPPCVAGRLSRAVIRPWRIAFPALLAVGIVASIGPFEARAEEPQAAAPAATTGTANPAAESGASSVSEAAPPAATGEPEAAPGSRDSKEAPAVTSNAHATRRPAAAPAAAPAVTEPAAVVMTEPPADFGDMSRWLDWKRDSRRAALPIEARVYYHRALTAHQSGDADEALRLAHGAVELDPTFLAARWTVIRWETTHDFAQALAQASGLINVVRSDFATQWSLAANAVYLVLLAWALGLLATAILVLIQHQAMLRHPIEERLRRWVSPWTSRIWTWGLLAAPFALGFGVALPVIVYLAMLFRALKARERAIAILLFATVAAAPLTVPALDRLARPLRTAESPLLTLLPLEVDPAAPAAVAELDALAARLPDDPFVRFGAGWRAHHAGDWTAAEADYRAVLVHWPGDDRVLDDLGATLAMQGRWDDAIATFKQAVESNPRNATAWFNLSQAYTRGYDFDGANRALSRASALDFDRVREFKNQPASGGALDPVAEWLAPRRAWGSLAEPRLPVVGGSLSPLMHGSLPLAGGSLPPFAAGRLETSGLGFSIAAAVAAAVGLLLGWFLGRGLPVHRCGNCERVVCRRCSERRRAQALCRPCARVAGSASSPDFARILLAREKQRSTRWAHVASLAAGIALPAAGLVLHRRVWRALMLLVVGAGAGLALAGSPWAFAARPRFDAGAGVAPIAIAVAALCVYVPSWLGLLGERARARKRAVAEKPARASRTGERGDAPAPRREAA